MHYWSTTLAILTISAWLTGCACPDESDYLTVGVVSTNDVYTMSTAPDWNGTYIHPAGQMFQATALWGLEDPAPREDLFELFTTTSGQPEPAELRTVACQTDSPGQELDGECSAFGGSGSCPHRGRAWIPVDGLSTEESYLLVLYPNRGNGRTLSWDGDRTEFQGGEALTMMLEVGPPVGE